MQQLVRVERLRHMRLKTGRERAPPILVARVGRQRECGGLRMRPSERPKFPNHIETICIWHGDVADYELRQAPARSLQRFGR